MITASDRNHHERFARELLQAMGIGSVAGIAALLAGCTGEIIQGQAAGSGAGVGGAGGGAMTTGASTGAGGASTSGAGVGGGPWSCNVPVPPSSTLVYACLQGPQPSPCLPSTSQEVITQLHKQLDVSQPPCGGKIVSGVPCGPDPNAKGCCYVAILGPGFCEGRPFTVEGRARTVTAISRTGWSASLAPDTSRLDAATRRALAAAWERDAGYEHASIASFARFALELLSAGAPAELLAEAHRAMGDELRHAELCFGLAGAYAGIPLGPGRFPMAGALEGRDDLAAIAVATVKEGCIGETIAALVAQAMRDGAADPAVRSALDQIAADEARHAALAWRFVAWAIAEGPAEVASAVASAFAEHAASTPASAPEADVDWAAMRAHGRLPEDEVGAIAAHALAEVIQPCARAMLGVASSQLC